ncbi:Ubiquitin carboxyl-terminal hydrolase 19 [Nymphaea thermarum]|nr:Ubiquitin carboxyl-terminal hydrolase 19 [Nymphaea thermarum]
MVHLLYSFFYYPLIGLEFQFSLIFAIDTMQSICLDEFGGEKAIEPSCQETTLIHHIFGGYLQSQVICSKCNKISNRYENMMDLTVEIQGGAESLEECLNQFTVKEWLEGENMYKCDGCNGYVTAWKRLTVHQAPNVLTIALKRFQSGRFGKLNKRVTFPETLDLGPYISEAGDGTNIYRLYAIVVHVDMLNASFFGHYICYTKDNQGNWYRIDDCKVMKVELEEVLSQRAYMLLYSRINVRPSSGKTFKVLKNDDEQSVSIEELPCPTTSSISIVEPLHVTSPGRQMPDWSVELGIEVQRSQPGSATGKEDSADVLVHAKSKSMGMDAVPTSQNNSCSVTFNGPSSSSEVSVSRSEEPNLGGHTNHDLPVDGCTTSNSMWDSYDCNEVSSKHKDQMQLDHGQFNYGDLSVNGISHASASLELSRKMHVATSSIPSQLSATERITVPPVDENVEKGITETGRICTDGLVDDNALLSPKESLLRSFRRPKPLFAPGFSDKAAGMNRNSLDNYKADRSPDHFGQLETTDGEILTTEYNMKTSSLCNGFAHSFLGSGDGEIDNGSLTDLEPYRNGSRLLANCERPRQETY